MNARGASTGRGVGCLVCDGRPAPDGRAAVPVGSGFVHVACLSGLPTDVIAEQLVRTIEREGAEVVARRARCAARDYDRPIEASLLWLAGTIERAAAAARDAGRP